MIMTMVIRLNTDADNCQGDFFIFLFFIFLTRMKLMQKKQCQLVVSFSRPTNSAESPQDESDFQNNFCCTQIPNPSSDDKPQAASQLNTQRSQKQTS